MMFRALVLAVAAVAAPAAFAQPADPPAQQPAPQQQQQRPAAPRAEQAPLTLTPAQRAADTTLARDQIARIETEVFGACAANDLAVTRVSGRLAPLRVAQDNQVRARGVAVYRYVFNATGCGRPARRHNIEILHHRTLPAMAIALPMGTSPLTSVVLQGAFDTIFEPMMVQRYASCSPTSRLKIIEANLTSGAPYVVGRPWTETWRYDACGAKGTATMEFAYDRRGVRMGARVVPDDAPPSVATPER